MPTKKHTQTDGAKRYIMRRVVSSEVTGNWNLRLKLSCGHEVIVRRTKPGKTARCAECGAIEKPYESE